MKRVDPTTSLRPNHLKNPNSIEDKFFHPHYIILQEQENLPLNARKEKYMKASTISSKISSITALMDYVKRRNVYIGLSLPHMTLIEDKVKELNSSLKKFAQHRTVTLRKWKNDNILTLTDTLKYGSHQSVMYLVKLLNAFSDGHNSKITSGGGARPRSPNVHLTMVNAARSSNLMNMTVEDFNRSEQNEEFGCFLMRNSVYKTSLLYGDKVS